MSFIKKQYPHLKLYQGEQEDQHILWLSLNNPEARNAITNEMVNSLEEALKLADQDSKVRVIVLTGEGKSFCAGGDLKAMENKAGMFAGNSDELRNRYSWGIQRIPKAIEALQKPIIAMVNGAAIGAGCDLAAMCDLRIASDRAKFAETFSKLSLIPGDGGTFFLQRIVGFSKAMEMFLTGDVYSAEEALDMGLINKMVDSSSLKEETAKLARKIAHNAPIAIGMTKKAMKNAYRSDLISHLDLLSSFQGITQRSEDHFEALQAFKEKRDPQFKGR